MRILSTTYTPCVAALSLALLTAGCDRLESAAISIRNDQARTTLVKDSSGKMVRLDPVTGQVTPARAAEAPAATPRPRTSKRTRMRAVAVHPRVEPAASAPEPSPAPALIQSTAVTVPQPEAASVDFAEFCAEPLDLFAVTLVETGIYRGPSVGSLVNRVESGSFLTTSGASGEWVRVSLQRIHGPVSGFVHCSALRRLPAADKARLESYATEEF